MQRLKKISKFLFRIVLYSFLILLLCAVLIQVPAVQQYLTGSLENYLQDKFQTEVNIESIRLRLPESLVLKGVYIEDEQQDTFLNMGEIAVNFKLNKLLYKSIQFDKITLKNAEARILIEEDGSSFDFIISAFGQNEITPDSISTGNQNSSTPWDFTFNHSSLDLKNVSFRYKDKEALDLYTYVGRLKGSLKQVDLDQMNFQLDQLNLEDSQINLVLGKNQEVTEQVSTANPTKFFIDANVLALKNVRLDVALSSLELSTTVGQMASNAAAFRIDGNDINLQIPSVQIYETDVRYDILGAPKSSGFDYSHLNLQTITTDIADFEYDNLKINANIKQLSGIANEGFEVNKLQSIFSFTEQQITLKDFIFQSPDSDLNSNLTIIQYPFLEKVNDPLTLLKIESDIIANFKNSTDLVYFYPPLDRISFFQNSKELPLKLRADLKGDYNDLSIKTFDLDGFNMRLIADGSLKNFNQQDDLDWNINLREFKAIGEEIASLIPDSLLPEFIDLPDTIALSGTSKGGLQHFQTQIVGQTNRKHSPIATQIKANGIFKHILNPDSAYLHLQLDTFYTTREDVLAYMPPGVLPDYVNLPDHFILRGSLKGPFTNLESNLDLLTYRNNEANEVKAIGSISGLFTAEQPTFDVTLDAASISQAELMALLPDSLMPAYFELPFIKNLSGFFRGDFENFNTKFELESNTGKWSVDASLMQEAYQLNLKVDEFQTESIFIPGYLDSLTNLSFLPLSVDVQLKGQGIQLSDQVFSDFMVTIKSAADTTMKGLTIEGRLDQQILSASAFANETEIKVAADFELDYTKTNPEWNVDLFLEQLDLQALQYSDIPFLVNGRLNAKVIGYTLDSLNGKVTMSDWGILYNEKTAQMDSLLLTADLNTEISQVKINSDFFNAAISGNVQFPEVTEALQQQIFSYWQPGYPDSLIGKTDDYFDFEFSLFRPELLTIGFIPGLEELSPFELEGNYNNKNGEVGFFTDIPFFKWQKSNFEKLSIQAKGNDKALDYQIKFSEADIQEFLNLKNFTSLGSLVDNVLENTTQILDDEMETRFELKSVSSFSENLGFHFSLAPEQILNYQKWSVTKSNAINWHNDLSITDWRLYTDQEAIEIRKSEKERLELSFREFDLNIFSDLLNPPVEPTGSLKDKNLVNLDGIVNGTFSFADPKQQSAITSALKVDSLVLFNALLGDLNLFAETEKGEVVQAEVILRGNGNNVRLIGDFDLEQQFNALDFQLDFPALNLNSIEPLIFGYLENMEGQATGSLQINGSLEQPGLNGKVNFENAAFDVALAKARLRLGNEAIIFDSNVIEFKDLKIFDANNSKGIMSSYILTDDYRNFYLQSNIKVKNFQVLNTTIKDNDLYFGKLLVDATVDLSGNITEPTVEVTALPAKNSDLTYIYSAISTQIESHEGVVEFIQPKKKEERKIVNKPLDNNSGGLNMKVTVRLAVNDNLNFKAITDPITGDYFEGKAKGDLVYIQHPDGKMELNGSLELVKGEYLFTYQKLIRRPFEVKPGGTISWTGDPFDPRMNIDVLYKVKTSTYPLLASSSDNNENSGSQKQTFFVKLTIGGTLTKTEIATAIEYPQVNGNTNDQEVMAAIDLINQDEGQQNTQAFAMILFNGFLANDVENSDFKVIDVSGNINNMITSQLNNIANRYIKFVELDFGLDTESNSANESSTDFRVSIRKRFLNDRLTISLDGKTTNETGIEAGESQNYLDNVTVEYALTPDGRFKIKIYNSREYDDFIGGTGVKLGGAFVFSKDFNGIRLFGKKK